MSEASSNSEATSRKPGPLFFVGFVLWGAVFVSLYFVWQQRGEEAELKVVDDGGVAVTATAVSESEMQHGETAEPVEIDITWPEAGVREFSFTDSQGEVLSKSDLLGKPWIASFIFTRCAGPCPRVAAAVKNLEKRYPDSNVNFVTFTVDPENDTPEVLAKFADFWEADPERWFFLTGDMDETYEMIQKDFLMPVGPSPDPEPGWEIIHTTNVCLVDQTGKVVGKYNSLKDEEIAQLRRELDALLKASDVAASGTDVVEESDADS